MSQRSLSTHNPLAEVMRETVEGAQHLRHVHGKHGRHPRVRPEVLQDQAHVVLVPIDVTGRNLARLSAAKRLLSAKGLEQTAVKEAQEALKRCSSSDSKKALSSSE